MLDSHPYHSIGMSYKYLHFVNKIICCSLKEKIVEESPLPLLHLFTTSVLICVQASIKDCDICPTSTFQSILSFESRRMNLIERLCIALKVSAKINDHSLSLQIVVLLYVLLVPFMQHFIFNYHLIEVSTCTYFFLDDYIHVHVHVYGVDSTFMSCGVARVA